MSRGTRRDRKQNESRRTGQREYDQEQVAPQPPVKASGTPLQAQTDAQQRYIDLIWENKLTFGVGPAGTGKTYVCGALAAEALRTKETRKLIVTRPAVEAGENLGFLPGELDEKFEPFLAPFRQVLEERMGAGAVEYFLKTKAIEVVPLAYMRGRTFKNCWVILDEAQNTTPAQMKLFLTRIGENSRVIINGDMSQVDIKGTSGLTDAVRRLDGLNDVGVAMFRVSDVVRSGLVRDIIERYEPQEEESNPFFNERQGLPLESLWLTPSSETSSEVI